MQAGCSRLIRNFSDDIKDSEIYTELIAQVAPRGLDVDKSALSTEDWLERAEIMLTRADKINCRAFVSSKVKEINNSDKCLRQCYRNIFQDVVNGHEKLNLAFVANLFNHHPGLEPPEHVVDIIEETREEKMFRNWINSLGVCQHVNYLYSDLNNGWVIFHLMDTIQPGSDHSNIVHADQ